MIPPAFEYVVPTSLPEALALLRDLGDARILSGGHSLIPMLKLRLSSPACLIDINRIPGLDRIEEEGDFLVIGALAREAQLERSELIRRRYPLLHETAAVIGDPQVRNLATIGGNLAHGDPANDHPATMLAYGAVLEASSTRGTRSIPIGEFFHDFFETDLAPDEILTAIRIPRPGARSGGAYEKLERKVGDYAVAAVAVQLEVDSAGTCTRAGIGLTNVGPTAIQATAAESALRGSALDESSLRKAAGLAAEAAQPNADLRGSVDYKRAMVKELGLRALRRAAQRAKTAA